ncbi:hypothetical protein A1Q1_02324 [Trichosporon asahii var. asahii CBS 2479]|uniref:Uncharacterized protein n=1 Tax=Trichosporon asahii var. asahii (strain ATCC 90039 / CBS 2479 / JCM 2466 / KCTC 7840 / NBRC 103889/ NCYC 2677 / UAMH 7654) TaxID=1186058 RepID=J6F0D9_TRIAS|nr:hypothetical protein A1Q1_02324 [Trichosporon asahii var. asahii CBS 2479]EJT48597.1 hypothetical protein A1Q1_02324 [Trichosporon asahii var. asahii CBS 2479]
MASSSASLPTSTYSSFQRWDQTKEIEALVKLPTYGSSTADPSLNCHVAVPEAKQARPGRGCDDARPWPLLSPACSKFLGGSQTNIGGRIRLNRED